MGVANASTADRTAAVNAALTNAHKNIATILDPLFEKVKDEREEAKTETVIVYIALLRHHVCAMNVDTRKKKWRCCCLNYVKKRAPTQTIR